MKRSVILFVCLVLFISLGASTIQENIEATAKRLIAELGENTRSIPYVHQNFFPLTYAMTMNTREFGPTNMLAEVWDGTEWQDAMQWDFYYDADGLITGYDQYFYGPGYTVAYFYYDIEYDDQDRVRILWMDLDMGTGLVTGSHEIYDYSTDGLSNYFLEGDYGVGSYVNQVQADFTYTGGELTEGHYQSWDEDNSTWVDDYKHTFTYDGGLLDTVLYEFHDGTQWMNEYFSTYTMIDECCPDEYIVEMWNGSSFENSERFTYTYNRYEHDERLEEDWDNGGWINAGFEEVTFDNDGNPLQVDRYVWDGTDWADSERYTYEYGPSSVDPNTIEPVSNLSNYPNPFNPETTISFETTNLHENARIEIYNLKGQLIKTLVNSSLSAGEHSYIWNGIDNDGKSVTSGVYFYILSLDGKIAKVRKCLLLK
ncbi:MAG: T9SS type A sorting domain-containing protein [FCB group bacterium]|nr:T9SS type A sorting domain-containing protein [FCB group bacterium]